MAMKFGSSKGAAQKGVPTLAYKDGENTIRIFGDILPRYVYFIKGKNNKDIPMECLSFNREEERFTNEEKDWVKEMFPTLKCGWSYCIMGYSLSDKKVVVVNLKKKLFEQIRNTAEDLGDPTDPVTGWDINFKRVKTGPMVYNVEYTLNPLRCKVRALSNEELELIKASKTIDELVPRLTADEQKKFLDGLDAPDSTNDNTDAGTADTNIESVDDIPQ